MATDPVIVYHECPLGAPVDMIQGETCLRCKQVAGEERLLGAEQPVQTQQLESMSFNEIEARRRGDMPPLVRETLPEDRNAADILDEGASTYRQRNKIYGDNYKRMGTLMLALFPDGAVPPCETEEDANRLNLLIDCLGKLQRYAYNFHVGGHKDSAHDLMVYAAMLEEMTNG